MTKEVIRELPVEDFKKTLSSFPIACIDIVVRSVDSKILLIKRKEKPAKGDWWFPGGRIFKNEEILDAISRKLKDEVGIEEVVEAEQIGAFETIFEDGPFEEQSHTINITYIVELSKLAKDCSIVLQDKFADDYRWVVGREDFICSYVKNIIRIAEEEW